MLVLSLCLGSGAMGSTELSRTDQFQFICHCFPVDTAANRLVFLSCCQTSVFMLLSF